MDLWLLEWSNQHLTAPWLDFLMVGLTRIGLWALPLAGLALWASGRRRIGLALLLALGCSLTFTFVFYYLALRPRPVDVRLILPAPRFPSYLSGHAAGAFAVAVVLALHYRHWAVRTALFVLATAIASSRVYLGHHFPSDVLAGVVLGAALGAVCYGLAFDNSESGSRWRWLLWPQVALIVLATQMAYLDLLPGHLLRWPFADKVLHFLLFGLVAFWLNLWLNGRTWRVAGWKVPVAVVLPLVVALVEEGLQLLSPLRSASLSDLACDLLGVLCFWWLSQWILIRSARSELVRGFHPLNR